MHVDLHVLNGMHHFSDVPILGHQKLVTLVCVGNDKFNVSAQIFEYSSNDVSIQTA